MLRIFIPGLPAPQGSKRHVGRGILVESSKRAAPWRADVRAALDGAARIDGPVEVTAWFFFPRPAGHYGTGRNADRLRPSAPAYPTSRQLGDIDKLQRSTLDAIVSAGVLGDDSQVTDVHAHRRWVSPGIDRAGCLLTIEEMES